MTTSTINSPIKLSQSFPEALFSWAFGLTPKYGIGLAQQARLQKAAHDTRHAIGCPCH